MIDKKTSKRTTEELVILFITSFASFFIFLFAIYRILERDWVTALVDIVIVAGMMANFFYVKISRKVKLPSLILVIFTSSSLCILVFLKGPFPIFWAFPIIISAYFLFKPAIAVSVSFILLFVLILLTYGKIDQATLFTFIATALIASIFSFAFSQKMGKQHRQILRAAKIIRLKNEVLELIIASSSLSQALMSVTKNIEQSYPRLYCSILLLDATNNTLSYGAAPSLPDKFKDLLNGNDIAKKQGSCALAAYSGKRVITENIASDPLCESYKEQAQQAGLVSCWSEPIFGAKGNVLGTLAVYHKMSKTQTKTELSLMEQFASIVGIAIEREQSNHLIWQQANFDQLTGLPNRNMMREHLQKSLYIAERTKEKIAIAFLDLDHFKDVNDTLGHSFGDKFLKEASNRIQGCLRKSDTVARLGGDEFVIVMLNVTDFSSVEKVTQHLIKTLSEPYIILDEVVHSSVSIGVTISPDDGKDIDLLLKNADQAMYGAKNSGRNACHYFTPTMRQDADSRFQLIQDMRLAIEREEFELFYQPIICLRTNKITKAEALIRWHHPEKGMVSPADFIAIAEETGLIVEISNWIIEQVMSVLTDWRQSIEPDFQISVNTSPLQYKNIEGNISHWVDLIENRGLNMQSIVFEITENLLLDSEDDILNTLEILRKRGVAISIDDFGTGYSSFSYLKKYHTDFLKIDKSFVQKISMDEKDLALCEAIIVMAKKLKIQVIAEGIETEHQRNLLTDIGCDYGQGYWFSHPLPVPDFEHFMQQTLIKKSDVS